VKEAKAEFKSGYLEVGGMAKGTANLRVVSLGLKGKDKDKINFSKKSVDKILGDISKNKEVFAERVREITYEVNLKFYKKAGVSFKIFAAEELLESLLKNITISIASAKIITNDEAINIYKAFGLGRNGKTERNSPQR